jgi:hypothetical protein
MRIDAFNHFFPQGYFERMAEVAGDLKDMFRCARAIPSIHDFAESIPTTWTRGRRCTRSGGRSTGPTRPASRWRVSSS